MHLSFATTYEMTIADDGQIKKSIFMQSDDRDFLKDRIRALDEYTKRIDATAILSKPDVFKHSAENQKRIGYGYFIPIHTRLPRAVAAFWKTPDSGWGCCRRGAAIAAGILPAPVEGMVLSEWGDACLALAKHATSIIWSGPLMPGDLILGRSHSFVYLDHEICLSKNGFAGDLEIQSVEDVRRRYFPEFPENFLRRINEQGQMPHEIEFTVFRKNNDFHYPDEITEQIIKICHLWQLKNSPESSRLSQDQLKDSIFELKGRVEDLRKSSN